MKVHLVTVMRRMDTEIYVEAPDAAHAEELAAALEAEHGLVGAQGRVGEVEEVTATASYEAGALPEYVAGAKRYRWPEDHPAGYEPSPVVHTPRSAAPADVLAARLLGALDTGGAEALRPLLERAVAEGGAGSEPQDVAQAAAHIRELQAIVDGLAPGGLEPYERRRYEAAVRFAAGAGEPEVV